MPFTNPFLAGLTLVREAIRSPNYVPGVSGWSINKDGSAEFSDMNARGTIVAGVDGTTVTLDDTGVAVTSDDVGPGVTIDITTDIPGELLGKYSPEGVTISTATLYYTGVDGSYWYEAAANTIKVRGYVNSLGTVVEIGRDAIGMPAGLQLREVFNVAASGSITPASTTPTLVTGTETSITTADYDPLTVYYEVIYTADMEQVGSGNSTTVCELYIDGASVPGHRQILFNPGNTSTAVPAQRDGGLTQSFFGSLANSATPQVFGLYGSRALGAGTNRINATHTGYLLKLYY